MPKQVLVYRRDLKMRKGKIAAQCAHASLAVFLRGHPQPGTIVLDGVPADPARTLVVPLSEDMASWVFGRFKKVVLSVETEADLVEVHRLALEAGLPTALIRDAGLTEFGGVPTLTTVALGPADEAAIDRITGPTGRVSTKLA